MNDIQRPLAWDAELGLRAESRDREPGATELDRAAVGPGRRTGRRLLAWVTFALLCAALGIGVWRHYRLHAQVMATAEQRRDFVPSVRTAPVRASDNTIAVTWPGNTEAFEQANIYARASGYVSRREVDIGSHVKSGQLLVEITAPELEHQIAQAEGTLAQMQAALELAKANRDLAQVTWGRDKKLVGQGWVTLEQGDTDRLTLQAREAAVAVAAANITAQEAQLRVLNQQKAYQSVVAPFDGVITQRNVDIGSLVQADATSGTFLFTLMHSDTIRIQLYVPQDEAFGLAPRSRGGGARARDAGSRFSWNGDPNCRRAAARDANTAHRDRRAQSRPRLIAGNLLHRRTEDPAQDAVPHGPLGVDHLQPRGS